MKISIQMLRLLLIGLVFSFVPHQLFSASATCFEGENKRIYDSLTKDPEKVPTYIDQAAARARAASQRVEAPRRKAVEAARLARLEARKGRANAAKYNSWRKYGYTFQGPKSNGELHGYGVIKGEGGSRAGKFDKGKLTGYGVYDCCSYGDDVYLFEGEYDHGNFGSYGILTEARPYDRVDYRYEGKFKNPSPHGYGRMTFPNGDRSEGSFHFQSVYDFACYGIYTFADGTRFEGQLKGGTVGGLGIKTHPNGTVEKGRWGHPSAEFVSADKVIEEYYQQQKNLEGQ